MGVVVVSGSTVVSGTVVLAVVAMVTPLAPPPVATEVPPTVVTPSVAPPTVVTPPVTPVAPPSVTPGGGVIEVGGSCGRGVDLGGIWSTLVLLVTITVVPAWLVVAMIEISGLFALSSVVAAGIVAPIVVPGTVSGFLVLVLVPSVGPIVVGVCCVVKPGIGPLMGVTSPVFGTMVVGLASDLEIVVITAVFSLVVGVEGFKVVTALEVGASVGGLVVVSRVVASVGLGVVGGGVVAFGVVSALATVIVDVLVTSGGSLPIVVAGVGVEASFGRTQWRRQLSAHRRRHRFPNSISFVFYLN